MVLFCSAHAQLDDSFDEEYEVANYNLAQSAELEAAARVSNAAVQQPQQYEQQQQQHQYHQQQPQMSMQIQQNYPLQPQTYSYSYTAHKQMLPLTNCHNSSSDPMQIDNLVSANGGFQPSNSRKLKRSCDFECDSPATDASGSKRVKQIAF
ncbi:hypothetical protein TWF281_000213 [Arthrobotrys megalospora]